MFQKIHRFSITLGLVFLMNHSQISFAQNSPNSATANDPFLTTNNLDPAKDLIVRAGEVKVLPAKTHKFRKIYVQDKGTLVIPQGSSRWSIWWAEDDVHINGKVTGQGFARKNGKISSRTPDNKTVSYEFSHLAVGGTGGAGGVSQVTAGNVGSAGGGLGAVGTKDYGGGGGSGGGVFRAFRQPSRVGSPGQAAVDWRGAPPALTYGVTSGTDGKKTDLYSNGALLLIRSGGEISGDGVFNFQGDDGGDGKNGMPGKPLRYDNYSIGHGGGGGGAPGGEGGYIILVADTFTHQFELRLDGGKGGKGGTVRGNSSGENGDFGGFGSIDEILLGDWLK